MSKLTYQDFSQKMIDAKETTTQNWDVLCAYSIDKVNEIFAREHAKYPLLANTQFSVETEVPGTPIKYTQTYNIHLGNPTIKFLEGQKGQCEVLMPVSGSVNTVSDSHTYTSSIPVGYNITILAPLVNIIGDNDLTEAGTIVVFGTHNTAKITLHFEIDSKHPGSLINYQPPTEEHDIDTMMKGLVTGFASQIKKVDYNIVQVKADSSFAADVKLTPKSFIFTSSGRDTDSVLNVWIQTNESGNNIGNPNPVFEPGGTEYLALPQGYSASIIFAKSVIQNLYIKPALVKLGCPYSFTDLDPSGTNNGGIGVVLKPAEYRQSYSYSDHSLLSNVDFTCDDLVINYTSNPIFINFLKNKVHIKWDWNETLSYSKNSSHMGSTEPELQEGRVKITALVDKNTQTEFNDQIIEIAVSCNSSDVNVTTQDVGENEWWHAFLGVFNIDDKQFTQKIADNVKNTPNFNISLGSLNYFAEANVIFEEKEFHAATDIGINFTGDLLIVGDIA